MTDTREFLEAFRETAQTLGSRRLLTPTDMIGSWRWFVELCEQGYGDSIYEFSNDLAVRDFIMNVLDSVELRKYSQMGWVRDEIDEIDERYRALLRDDEVRPGRPWWQARIPRLAGAELAEDFASRYGGSVAVVGWRDD